MAANLGSRAAFQHTKINSGIVILLSRIEGLGVLSATYLPHPASMVLRRLLLLSDTLDFYSETKAGPGRNHDYGQAAYNIDDDFSSPCTMDG